MSASPDVSVLIPFHGECPYLGEALASLAVGDSKEFEVILAADRPSSSALSMAERYCASHEYARLVAAPSPGIVTALNTALREVRAPLVARMDADDRSRPGRLRAQAAFLKSHSNVAVVGTQVAYIDEAGERKGDSKYPTRAQAIDRIILWECPIAHPTVMARTDAISAAGGFRDLVRAGSISLAEDFDLWNQIARLRPSSIVNLPQVLLDYRQHGGQVTTQRARETTVATLGVTLWHLRERRGLTPPFTPPIQVEDLQTSLGDPGWVSEMVDALPREERREFSYRAGLIPIRFATDRRVQWLGSARHVAAYPVRATLTASRLLATRLAQQRSS